jgi:hypothetical protein
LRDCGWWCLDADIYVTTLLLCMSCLSCTSFIVSIGDGDIAATAAAAVVADNNLPGGWTDKQVRPRAALFFPTLLGRGGGPITPAIFLLNPYILDEYPRLCVIVGGGA